MKVLITGATGFIGQHFLKRMRERQIKTVCLVRKRSVNLERLKNFNIEIRIADLEDAHALNKDLFKDIEFVFHFAGSVFGKTRKELFQSNLQMTENLYRTLRSSPVRRFIFLSSLAAVGPVSREKIITEETSPKPVSYYGLSKLEAERRVREAQREVGTEICVVRSPLVYGEGFSPQSRLSLFIDRISTRSFRFIGDGENVVTLCQVDNLVDFLLRVMEFGSMQYEIFHVADPNAPTLKQLASLVAENVGVETPSAHIPIPLAFILAFSLEAISKVIPLEPYLTPERVRELSGNWGMDLTKVKRWGFEPREDWKEQLLKTISWYCQNKLKGQ